MTLFFAIAFRNCPMEKCPMKATQDHWDRAMEDDPSLIECTMLKDLVVHANKPGVLEEEQCSCLKDVLRSPALTTIIPTCDVRRPGPYADNWFKTVVNMRTDCKVCREFDWNSLTLGPGVESKPEFHPIRANLDHHCDFLIEAYTSLQACTHVGREERSRRSRLIFYEIANQGCELPTCPKVIEGMTEGLKMLEQDVQVIENKPMAKTCANQAVDGHQKGVAFEIEALKNREEPICTCLHDVLLTPHIATFIAPCDPRPTESY